MEFEVNDYFKKLEVLCAYVEYDDNTKDSKKTCIDQYLFIKTQ